MPCSLGGLQVISWAYLVQCGTRCLLGNQWVWALRPPSGPLVLSQRSLEGDCTGTPRAQEDEEVGKLGPQDSFYQGPLWGWAAGMSRLEKFYKRNAPTPHSIIEKHV